VLAALLSDPARTAQARQACAPTAGRWVAAARHGLADRELHRAAVAVFELAVAALPGLEPPPWLVSDLADVLERRVRRGLCPADLDTADLDTADLPTADPDTPATDHLTSAVLPHPTGDPEEASA
jgi:glutamate--cysteine ligase